MFAIGAGGYLQWSPSACSEFLTDLRLQVLVCAWHEKVDLNVLPGKAWTLSRVASRSPIQVRNTTVHPEMALEVATLHPVRVKSSGSLRPAVTRGTRARGGQG